MPGTKVIATMENEFINLLVLCNLGRIPPTMEHAEQCHNAQVLSACAMSIMKAAVLALSKEMAR